MDTELDNLLDATLGDESAEPDEPESADESELADGQAEEESADDDAEEADESESADDDDDELSQLRQRLESVEAERANERAALQTREAQRLAAEEEAKIANDLRGWMAHYDQRRNQAKIDAQQTYNPLEAYAVLAEQIEAERTAKVLEYATYRTSKIEDAYQLSQRPAFADYINEYYGLDGVEAAKIKELASKRDFNPDNLRHVAESLKELRATKVQEQRAEKAASLKKSAVKPGGGSPHKAKPKDLDAYLDQALSF